MTGRLLVARVLLYNLKGPRRSGLGASHAIQPNSLDMYVGHLFRKKIMSFDVSVTKIHMYTIRSNVCVVASECSR